MIEVATIADHDAICDLLAASYPPLLKPHYESATLARILPAMIVANPYLLSSGRFYFARKDGNAIACGGWSVQEPGTGDVAEGIAHIRHFATNPKWTRRGLAQDIMARCVIDARANGARKLMCFAAKGSEPFYAACGFKVVDTIELEIARGAMLPATLMTRQIG